jgi:hypothetical protein
MIISEQQKNRIMFMINMKEQEQKIIKSQISTRATEFSRGI